MKDEGKTEEQLINELDQMRQRPVELEVSETEHKQLHLPKTQGFGDPLQNTG